MKELSIWGKLRKSITAYPFLWFAMLLIIGKQLVAARIPIYIIPNNVYDDQLMVKISHDFLCGRWLGDYDCNTLVKGMMFPALLAVIKGLGFSYVSAMTMIYSLSCLFFTFVIKDLFKKKFVPYVIFTVLLFNPVSVASWTLQRVYRNGITMAQVLVIFACFFALYIRRNKPARKLIGWAVLAGLTIFMMWNTREDGIWIMPFVIVVTLVLVGYTVWYAYHNVRTGSTIGKLKRFKLSITKPNVAKIIVMFLPLIILWGGNQIISAMNYAVYGIYTTNEVNSSNFTKVMKSIYAVKPEEDIQYVSVTREKLDRIYKVSPTLNSIKDEMEASMDAWAHNDRHGADKEVEDGWFFWAFRGAVADAGYYSDAKTANEFYKKVSEEIEKALDEGKLERQPTMPSALMSPWREGYTEQLIEASIDIVELTTGFTDVETNQNISIDNGSGEIHMYENMANNTSLHDMVEVIGWYFPKDGREFAVKIVDNKGNVYAQPQLTGSEDVYKDYADTEYANDTMKQCRFPAEINDYIPDDGLKLCVSILDAESEEEIDRIELNGICGETETSNGFYSIEKLTEPDDLFAITRPAVKVCNMFTKAYKTLGHPLAIIGVIAYLLITIYWIITLFYKKAHANRERFTTMWLFLTSVLLSYVVLMGGVAYNHIASCNSIFYMYLSGSYPLLIIFWSMAICFIVDRISFKGRRGRK